MGTTKYHTGRCKHYYIEREIEKIRKLRQMERHCSVMEIYGKKEFEFANDTMA